MGEPLLTHTLHRHGQDVRLALAGELNLSVDRELRAALDQALAHAPGTLTIDLGTLDFIDAASLAETMGAHRAATAAGRRLVVINPRGIVRRVLDIAGVLATITETPDHSTDPTRS